MRRVTKAVSVGILALSVVTGQANANWFTALVRDAEVAGKSAGRAGRALEELGPLRKAASFLDDLKNAPHGALAAHATPEGHWRFVNRAGETFTVGTPQEMARVMPALAPEALAAGQRKMTLYLSEDSVFANRGALDQIPTDAELFVVAEGGAYPLARAGRGAGPTLTLHLKPNIAMELADQSLFDETVFLLDRPLNKSSIRTLAFESGAGKSLPSAPRLDPESKVPLVDQIDPQDFAKGLASIRGQTALVTGRVEDGKLIVAASGGAETGLPIDNLVAAATRSNVNLIILNSGVSRQAGGTNWLWQRVDVGGLSDAAEGATYGDFLDALAARRGGFSIVPSRDGPGRVRISAVPDEGKASLSGDAANEVGDIVSHFTNEIVTKAVDISARDRSTQDEEDARLVPGIPTAIQFPYLAGLIGGVLGWATARSWWQGLMPQTIEATGLIAYAKRLGRWLVFLLVFLPIAGLPAFAVQTISQAVHKILSPFLWVRRRLLTNKV